jgi:hypothetical protein
VGCLSGLSWGHLGSCLALAELQMCASVLWLFLGTPGGLDPQSPPSILALLHASLDPNLQGQWTLALQGNREGRAWQVERIASGWSVALTTMKCVMVVDPASQEELPSMGILVGVGTSGKVTMSSLCQSLVGWMVSPVVSFTGNSAPLATVDRP